MSSVQSPVSSLSSVNQVRRQNDVQYWSQLGWPSVSQVNGEQQLVAPLYYSSIQESPKPADDAEIKPVENIKPADEQIEPQPGLYSGTKSVSVSVNSS